MFSRRPFTLVEVLIAFSLAAVLISTLMNIYWQVSVIHRESDEVRRRAFEVRYLQSRLADVLPKAIAPIAKGDKSLDFFFYTPVEIGAAGKSLVFSYDNGTIIVACGIPTAAGRTLLPLTNVDALPATDNKGPHRLISCNKIIKH